MEVNEACFVGPYLYLYPHLDLCPELYQHPQLRLSPIHPSIYLSVYPSIYLSIYPSIYLSIYPSVCLSRKYLDRKQERRGSAAGLDWWGDHGNRLEDGSWAAGRSEGEILPGRTRKLLQSLGSPSHLDLCRGLPSALPASAPYTFHRVPMWGLKGPFENVSDDITPLL